MKFRTAKLNNALVSVGHVCDQSKVVILTDKEAIIIKKNPIDIPKTDGDLIVPRNKYTGLYEFKEGDIGEGEATQNIKNTKAEDSLQLWNDRLIHTNASVLRSLSDYTKEFPELHGELLSCHPCLLGKGTKNKFNSNFDKAKYAGEIVYSDLAGKMPTNTYGYKYFISFIDHFTRFTHVTAIKRKSNTNSAFEQYKKETHVLKYFKNGADRLHSDGGGEYENSENEHPSTNTPYTPEHNLFTERTNRTFLDPVRVLLEESGLSAKYWDWALYYVAYIKNRIPHSALRLSPFQNITGDKPKLKHARVFGSAAFVRTEDPKSKVHARASPGIFLGCYEDNVY